MEFFLAAAIVVLVAWFITAPIRNRPDSEPEDPSLAELADLEARKRAKYQQIRDAEADHASGKLSDADYERLDTELRAEAIDILKKIDRLRPPTPKARDAS
jgi:hypothetical protein